MSEVPTRSDILTASSESGLLAYLFDVAETYFLYRESEFLATVAELIASGERTLFAERDWAFLNGMNGPNFFLGMTLFCELIPLLDIGHRDMMRFIATLVRLGDEGLAANQPNAAFRTWCSGDPARVRAVLDDAKTGDSLAIDYLCFALEAGAESTNALMFLNEGPGPKEQIGAAIALGKMTLDDENAAVAVRSLSEVSIVSNNNHVRNNALLSSFAILERNPELPREDAKRALRTALDNASAETLYALSTLIWRHGKSLSADEVESVLNALQAVDPEHRGTLEQIDFATLDLVNTWHFNMLSNLIAELIRRSQGKIRFNDFPTFRQELISGDSQRFGRLVVSWLLEGNPYICSSLAEQFSAVGGKAQAFDLERYDIPTEAQEQHFLCRKAAGYLFHAPIVAASIVVSVLRHGDDRIVDDLLALLNWPLLASFGGELVDYLDETVQRHSESVIARIEKVLAQKKQLVDQLDGIESLVELHPTEIHRHIERIHSSQQFSQAMKESMKQSILPQLATTQHLLYGEASSIYVQEPEGDTRRVDIEMNPSCHLWNAMSFSALIRITQTPTRMEEEAHGRKNYSYLLPV